MKIVVDEMPEEPKDCFLARKADSGNFLKGVKYGFSR